MKLKYHVWLFIAAVVTAAVFLLFTHPLRLPSLLLLLPSVLFFIVGVEAVFLAIVTGFRFAAVSISDAKALRISMITAGFPVVLLVMQSIGEITVRDVITVAILFILLDFYISRSNVFTRAD